MARRKESKSITPLADGPRYTLSFGRCFVFSSDAMTCPACGSLVAANVAHCCVIGAAPATKGAAA